MTTTSVPAARDYAAEYIRARRTAYRAATHNGRGDAIVRAGRVQDAAAAAGVRLDLDALEATVRELVGA